MTEEKQALLPVTPFDQALVEKALQDYIDGTSDKTLAETAQSIVRSIRNPCAKIFDHKWLDPECVETGCQSLVWKSRYEAAVKGRQEFRQALREERISHSLPGDVGMRGIVEAEKAHWLKEALKHKRPSGRHSDCAARDLGRAKVAQRILDKMDAALTPSATISDATKRMEQTLGAKFQATPSALSEDGAVEDAASRLRGWLAAGEQYARAGSTMRLDVFVSIALAQLDGTELPTAERLEWAINGIKAHFDDELLGDELRTLLAALALPVAVPSALSGDAGEVNRIVRIRVTSMHESCNRTTFYVELTTDEGFTMTPCGHATGSDYTEGKGLTIDEARDRAVTDAGTWGDFLRITPEPLIVDGVEIKPRVPMDLYTTRRVLAERRAALPSHQGAE